MRSFLRVPFGGPFSVPFRVHLGIHFRSLSGSQKGPEKEHSQQRGNSHHSVGDSSRKCRVASIRCHSPISLTLPLSSFGWLRNNSSSHRCSASFRNVCLSRRPCLQFCVAIKLPEMSATEAQLGLDLEVAGRNSFYGSSRWSPASWSCCEAIRRMREGV